jgi:hypothetical protein
MFWIALATLLTVSSALNAYQVVISEDGAVQLWRGAFSVILLFLGVLSLRKGLAARFNEQEATPGAIAAARATRQGMIPVLVVVLLIVIAIGAAIARRGPASRCQSHWLGTPECTTRQSIDWSKASSLKWEALLSLASMGPRLSGVS